MKLLNTERNLKITNQMFRFVYSVNLNCTHERTQWPLHRLCRRPGGQCKHSILEKQDKTLQTLSPVSPISRFNKTWELKTFFLICFKSEYSSFQYVSRHRDINIYLSKCKKCKFKFFLDKMKLPRAVYQQFQALVTRGKSPASVETLTRLIYRF